MMLTEMFPKDCIVDLHGTSSKEVLKEMLDVLVQTGRLNADLQGPAVRGILAREELGSTGIGFGVALPHSLITGVKDMIGVIGRSRTGIPFASLDGEPVYIFFTMLGPRDSSGQLLAMLAKVSRLVRDETIMKALRKMNSDVSGILAGAEEELGL